MKETAKEWHDRIMHETEGITSPAETSMPDLDLTNEYVRLMLELLWRQKNEGELDEETGLDYMARLDDLYNEMTEQEQDAMEEAFSRPVEEIVFVLQTVPKKLVEEEDKSSGRARSAG